MRLEFICNVPPECADAYEDVGSFVTPRVFVDADDRFRPLGENNFVGPPHGNHVDSDVGIYTRAGGQGISISQLLNDTIPEPTHTLQWGEDMSANVVEALLNGETAMLLDEDGNPYSMSSRISLGQPERRSYEDQW